MAEGKKRKGASGGAIVEKKKRGAYRKELGFCPCSAGPYCRLEGGGKEQWMHYSGYLQHMKKWHLDAEEQQEHKVFVGPDDEGYLERCVRCQSGFWTNQDRDRHIQVCYTAHTM